MMNRAPDDSLRPADQTVPGRTPVDDSQFGAVADLIVGAANSDRGRSSEPRDGQPKDPVIGDYVILEKIGSGGMGQIFRARHRRMDRIVALKVLPAAAMKDPEAVERFHREVKAAAQLFHPNIVTAFDAGEQDGIHYLVMEYVDGEVLSKVVQQHGPLPVADAANHILQAARGLQYAHSRDLVHRDIKPSNLILDSEGVIKILDLGTARFYQRAQGGDSSRADPASADGLTQSGFILGTVAYMAPEQATDARRADLRSDIYSLGCTLHYLLTAKAVYEGDLVQVLLAHAAQPVPSLRDVRPDVPERLDAVFQRMLAKKPEQRYQTMGDLIVDLENCGLAGLEQSPIPVSTRRAGAPESGAVESDLSTLSLRAIPAVGIDLGTSYSSIARLDEGGLPMTLTYGDGAAITPSVVLLDGSSIAVGNEAAKARALKPERVAQGMKRWVGEKLFPQKVNGEQYPPEVLLALVLKKLVGDASRQIGPFRHVVIGVPAFFDDVQRKSVQDAGYIAGLEVVDIINEPTAAAVAHHLQQEAVDPDEDATPYSMLVLDLGGGVFDATLLRIAGPDITALATAGDVRLGGREWDDRLVQYVAEQFVAEHGIDPRNEPKGAARIWQACEDAKLALSDRTKVTIMFQFQGRATKAKINRDQFEELTADLVDRMRSIIGDVLKSAEMNWSDVDQVVLSGRGARMPMVRRMVNASWGKDPDVSLTTGEAVAHGAALYAGRWLARKDGQPPRFDTHDVSSHSLGVVGADRRTGRKTNAVLIPRNSPLPATTKRTFKTRRAGQDSVLVQIVHGETESLQECKPIGKCVIGNLPADLPAGSPVTVEFHCAANGRLTVFVETSAAGDRATEEITRASGLSQEHLDRWREWVETMFLCSNV